jgi:hypothetical protein
MSHALHSSLLGSLWGPSVTFKLWRYECQKGATTFTYLFIYLFIFLGGGVVVFVSSQMVPLLYCIEPMPLKYEKKKKKINASVCIYGYHLSFLRYSFTFRALFL